MRAIVILLCGAMAVICYWLGFDKGIWLVIGAGMLFESLFWLGLMSCEDQDFGS